MQSDYFFFFFNDTATTEIYTLSLHDALPIFHERSTRRREARGNEALVPDDRVLRVRRHGRRCSDRRRAGRQLRSEEHTSELQSRQYLVCRLLLEKKKKNP